MKLTANAIKKNAIAIGRERPESFPSNAADYAEAVLAMPEIELHGRARKAVEDWIECIRESEAGRKGDTVAGFRVTVVNALITLGGEDEIAALAKITSHRQAAVVQIGDVVRHPATGRADQVVAIDRTQAGIVITVARRGQGRIFWLCKREMIDVFDI